MKRKTQREWAKEELKNPPIVEALIEIRWKLQKGSGPNPIDPHYQLLVGSLYSKIKDRYEFHEALPVSQVSDEVTGSVVKHRFRVAEGEWPLIQIGPGVMTVNQTKRYSTYESFKPLVLDAIKHLYAEYGGELVIEKLLLRYIDAKKFDYAENDVCEFLSSKMGIEIKHFDSVYQEGAIEKKPTSLHLQSSFRCNDPAGTATLSFSTGSHKDERSIVWNQILQSEGDDVPDMPDGFEEWIDGAHRVVKKWFDDLIEGDLKREFNE